MRRAMLRCLAAPIVAQQAAVAVAHLVMRLAPSADNWFALLCAGRLVDAGGSVRVQRWGSMVVVVLVVYEASLGLRCFSPPMHVRGKS